ncbi:hypothetical protein HJTV-2_gp88 [Haloarcula virus HJTV-2]|uniref:Uncharacterized protein n=1 Tax=Haloarcula virus HJTV-2 TaxID=2877986 RepID=A0AAE9BY30_9CAUD|nr:hypothetical protein M1M33_gp059 [Haloarcula virus HJTV-2]UBF21442.1 hypothetical protein HRTV-21_gp76 [Halorubrum virus HRTV-21]UBF21568.1 hypothetical protein HRTV-24_gp82 [Halorubrum virus HRTV-24]UBF21708.1 hypothetical protein HJTV-2_gp88 [Haloarcula virus HJTV-2]UBF22096.1 hypothetical protein HRTV-15_gp77 [Halorubrum virus HRTV-15]
MSYTQTSGDLEATIEPFGNGDEVDIISLDYPASWNDSTLLSAINSLADDIRADGLSVKNLSTWVNRFDK